MSKLFLEKLTSLCIAVQLLKDFCCNSANYIVRIHFIAELTLYRTLESGKDTSLRRPEDVAMSHNN